MATKNHLRLARLGGTVAAVSLLGAGVAASPAAAEPTTTLATCHASSCTGLSPAATNCNADAFTPSVNGKRFSIRTPEGILVRLRYSPSCRAAWARIDSADPGDRVRVHSSSGANFAATVAAGATAVHTRMVNDAGLVAWACVREDRNDRLTCTDRF
jgi:hypothetical protein